MSLSPGETSEHLAGDSAPEDNMKDDKTISRIRAVRPKISAKFGHDVERLGKYYMKRQSRNKHKLFNGS